MSPEHGYQVILLLFVSFAIFMYVHVVYKYVCVDRRGYVDMLSPRLVSGIILHLSATLCIEAGLTQFGPRVLVSTALRYPGPCS